MIAYVGDRIEAASSGRGRRDVRHLQPPRSVGVDHVSGGEPKPRDPRSKAWRSCPNSWGTAPRTEVRPSRAPDAVPSPRVMTRRFAAVPILALSLVACNSTSPTASPAATGAITPGPTTSPSLRCFRRTQRRRADRRAVLSGRRRILPADQRPGIRTGPRRHRRPSCPTDRQPSASRSFPRPARGPTSWSRWTTGRREDAWETSLSESASGRTLRGFVACGTGAAVRRRERPDLSRLGYHPLALATVRLRLIELQKVIHSPSKVELVLPPPASTLRSPGIDHGRRRRLEPQSGATKAAGGDPSGRSHRRRSRARRCRTERRRPLELHSDQGVGSGRP